MNIVQITPGAGGMYCGNCFRDNALVAELRRQGHGTLMVPLYLPMTLDEENTGAGTPIFFGGINVYLEQQSALFRRLPRALLRVLDMPWMLKFASGRAAKTRAADVGDLTLSMLRGEEGNQARELDELISWLRQQPRPDVICLSNALLVGLARRLKQELGATVVGMLQGEDAFLDAMTPEFRDRAWQTMNERARDVDGFIAPSHYFGGVMARRMGLPPERLRVVHNGINLQGFTPGSSPQNPPVLGFFARMCRDKGLDTLVEAFIRLRNRNRIPGLRLRIGGGCGPADEPFVAELRARLLAAGCLPDVEFHPNLTRGQKLEFLRSLTVLSVPTLYGEAFGLYVVEALASGVPVVQPRTASFPELVEATGGGVLCEPGSVDSLADTLEAVLADRPRLKQLREAGLAAVRERFSVEAMAGGVLQAFGAFQARGR